MRIVTKSEIQKPDLCHHHGQVARVPSTALDPLLVVHRLAGPCPGLGWCPGGGMPERKLSFDAPSAFLLPRALVSCLTGEGREVGYLQKAAGQADVSKLETLHSCQGCREIGLSLWHCDLALWEPCSAQSRASIGPVCMGVPSRGLWVPRLQPLSRESAFIRPSIQPSIHPPTNLSIHPSTHSFIHSSIISQLFANTECFQHVGHVPSAHEATKFAMVLPSRSLHPVPPRTPWWELMILPNLLAKGTWAGRGGRGWEKGPEGLFNSCLFLKNGFQKKWTW